ncbi:hypothetical protein CFIO01_08828, partial [Colletotrichum fioriniae PJ7]
QEGRRTRKLRIRQKVLGNQPRVAGRGQAEAHPRRQEPRGKRPRGRRRRAEGAEGGQGQRGQARLHHLKKKNQSANVSYFCMGGTKKLWVSAPVLHRRIH